MNKVDHLHAELEAMKITWHAFYQGLGQPSQEVVRTNVMTQRRKLPDDHWRGKLTPEQLELMDETLLAMTWIPT